MDAAKLPAQDGGTVFILNLSVCWRRQLPYVGKTPSGRREMSRIATEGGRPLASRFWLCWTKKAYDVGSGMAPRQREERWNSI